MSKQGVAPVIVGEDSCWLIEQMCSVLNKLVLQLSKAVSGDVLHQCKRIPHPVSVLFQQITLSVRHLYPWLKNNTLSVVPVLRIKSKKCLENSGAPQKLSA